MWYLIAKILALPRVSAWLINRAKRTPYFHLPGYMDRFWLVPYRSVAAGMGCGPVRFWRRPIAWLLQRFDVAIRVHHIKREDQGHHPHDHPWDFRTIILLGWYVDQQVGYPSPDLRVAGRTSTLKVGKFHHVMEVSPGGVWTLFLTRRYQGTWGFLVGGRKVKHTEYKG